MATDLHTLIIDYLELCGVDEQLLQQLGEALQRSHDPERAQNSRLHRAYKYVAEGILQVEVSSVSGSVYPFQATKQTSVRELKSGIKDCASIPVREQCLIHVEKVLEDAEPLCLYVSPLSAGVSLVRKTQCPKIYVLGGFAGVLTSDFTGEGMQASGELFDPITRAWAPLPAMTTPRARFATFSMDDESMVALGGYGPRDALGSVERLEFSSGTWMLLPQMEMPRASFSTVVIEDILYSVGGGVHPWGGTTADIHAFDLSRGSALPPLPPMSARRSRFGVTTLDGRIYVLGGCATLDGQIYALGFWNNDNGQAMAGAEVFDVGTATWTQLPPMATRRRALGAAALDGKVYAIGGFDGERELRTAEVFDLATSAWAPLPPMTRPRADVAAVALDGGLYVLGGQEYGQPTASVEVFTPSDGVWTPLPPMNTARCCHAAGMARLIT
mmetsp:Transcript_149942/g.462880  ORF Transcript_149942/g.462880 Transcript_149942/m.462880 type:complete len:443 (-) Transcript_149942:97-1425(-)